MLGVRRDLLRMAPTARFSNAVEGEHCPKCNRIDDENARHDLECEGSGFSTDHKAGGVKSNLIDREGSDQACDRRY